MGNLKDIKLIIGDLSIYLKQKRCVLMSALLANEEEDREECEPRGDSVAVWLVKTNELCHAIIGSVHG